MQIDRKSDMPGFREVSRPQPESKKEEVGSFQGREAAKAQGRGEKTPEPKVVSEAPKTPAPENENPQKGRKVNITI